MEAVVFSSKVDLWSLVFYAGIVSLVGLIVSRAMTLIEDRRARRHLMGITLLCAAPALVLPLWIFTSTHYTFDDATLRIDSGPFTWEIPVASISSVKPSRNFRSSPALSMDRLEIAYGAERAVLVSPSDEDAFLAELDRRR